MKKTVKLVLCVLLAMAMVVSLAACAPAAPTSSTPTGSTSSNAGTSSVAGGASSTTDASSAPESKYPEYLNLESYKPLVKDGMTQSLSFKIYCGSDYCEDPMDRWYWQMMEKRMNIDVEVTQMLSSAKETDIPLMFASETLPDVVVCGALTPAQMVLYGEVEGQLYDLATVINETLTPSIYNAFQTWPEMKTALYTSKGNLWAWPCISDSSRPTTDREIRADWLKALNLEEPRTLEDYIDVLYKFQEAYPDSIPLGGGWKFCNPGQIFFNAYGVVTTDSTGMTPAVYKGEVIWPAGHKEVYTEYVTQMRKLYEDKILDQDFFTLDQTSMSADAANMKVGSFAGTNAFIICPQKEGFQSYTFLPAMTSKLNETNDPFVARGTFYTCGGCYVSAKTEKIELIARWADWECTNEGTNANWVGAHKDDKFLMLEGWGGWYVNDKYSRVDVDRVDVPGGEQKWENAVVYLRGCVAGFDMGAIGNSYAENVTRQSLSGLEVVDYYTQYTGSPENGDFWWRISAMDELMREETAKGHYETILSNLLYLDADTQDRVTELLNVIKPHVETEFAKFVTGTRPLTELETYFTELDNLGFKELLGYYQEAYAGAVAK